MAKRWQKTELAYLERNAGSQPIEELAQRFNTDTATVESKIRELGLGSGGPGPDPALGDYEAGVKAMFDGNYEAASKKLEAVISSTESRQIRALARQRLNACGAQLGGDGTAPDDPYLTAVFEKNRGNFDAALDLVESKADGDERFIFLAASIRALRGDEGDEAAVLDLLGNAIELEPRNRVRAFNDPDFANLRGNEDFDTLVKRA